jgi:hypothetical protein
MLRFSNSSIMMISRTASICSCARSPAVPTHTLGLLKCLEHDHEREQPVYFQWQILDWDIPTSVRDAMGLELQPGVAPDPHVQPAGLTETSPPTSGIRAGTPTRTFRSRKGGDPSLRDASNRRLGLAGEEAVVKMEKKLLTEAGRPDLAEKVRHISKEEGDGAGYDIASFTTDGDVKYIEVKTTKGGVSAPFYISSNEVAFSEHQADHYCLYRVYDFHDGNGRFYVVSGAVHSGFQLTPSQYRAVIKPED